MTTTLDRSAIFAPKLPLTLAVKVVRRGWWWWGGGEGKGRDLFLESWLVANPGGKGEWGLVSSKRGRLASSKMGREVG